MCYIVQTDHATDTDDVELATAPSTALPNPMFVPDAIPEPNAAQLEQIYRRAPVGALAVAGIATGLVFALWLVFYLIVFLPRGFIS